tara:strand:+ start:302 stop:592 length:291 start_codon:yes stop_codon:yes gene_type:complete
MSEETQYATPSNECLQHSAKLSIVEDRPIMMDYWAESQDNNVIIGVRDSGEKLLVKSEDEYTSPISKIFKVQNEYIILTENSLYVVSSKISSKRIS